MRMNWWLGSVEFLKITSVIRRLLIFFLLLLLMLRKNSLLKIIFKTFYASKWIPFVLSNIQEFSSEKIVAAQAGVAILKFMKKHSESNLFLFYYLFYLFSTPQLLYAYDCLEIVHDLFLTFFVSSLLIQRPFIDCRRRWISFYTANDFCTSGEVHLIWNLTVSISNYFGGGQGE